MTNHLVEMRKIVEVGGDTYSSYEVIALIGWAVSEIERLREVLKDRLVLLQDAYAKIERLENKG